MIVCVGLVGSQRWCAGGVGGVYNRRLYVDDIIKVDKIVLVCVFYLYMEIA